MPMTNDDLAARFDEIADLLELEDANPFRIRAYRGAARTLESWPEQMTAWAKAGRDFSELPGIGDDLSGKIAVMLETGTCPLLERLRGEVPEGLTDLLKIPGLGPTRVRTLYHELGTHTPGQLLEAANSQRIRCLHGFGAASEKRIAEAVAGYLKRSGRFPIGRVLEQVESLQSHLQDADGVEQVAVAGSVRRRRDTVGDVDILVTAASGRSVIERFCEYDSVDHVLTHGSTRASVVLRNQLQVDLRVVRQASFGAALVYFTGSRAHNIGLRRIAKARGLKINEYGVYRNDRRLAGSTEESVYRTIGLPWIEPELREDRGEIDAARRDMLPALVERDDLRGDLHAHTSASDGKDTLKDMATAARGAGLEYLAITDHSKGLRVAHGLSVARLERQIDAIDALNAKLKDIVLLKGVEVDIGEDGSLDMPDDVLGRLDLVIGAVHSAFGLSRRRQTERILKAMDHPHFSILAHPNGRLFGTRGACDLDMERIIRHARERGCFLELNAQPDRLDLFDVQCRMARDAGVKISIASDAHGRGGFRWLELGVAQARRGWLERDDVLNARTLKKLRPLLAATM